MAFTFNPLSGQFDYYQAGVTAHSALTGLSADDHTQYALLAGRSGGQTLIGGTASGNGLTLQSTSHATKGLITFGTASVYNQVNDRFGISVTTPSTSLSFGGESARTIAMERRTTANTAGLALTVQSGGATSGATNKAAGNLILSTGISTGTGTGTMQFQLPTPGATGTGNNTPSTKFQISGSGAITQTIPTPTATTAAYSLTALTQTGTISNTGTGGVGTFIGNQWTHTVSDVTDGGVQGLFYQQGVTVDANDTGNSFAQLFAFEGYYSSDNASVGLGAATAVGGFLQNSGPGTIGGFTIFNAQTNVSTGATLSSYIGYFVNINILAGTISQYYGMYIGGVGSLTGTLSAATGIYIEDLTASTSGAYALYAAGGKSVHAGKFRVGSTTDPSHWLDVAAGTTTVAPIRLTSGTNLTTPVAGAIEFDGNFYYMTV